MVFIYVLKLEQDKYTSFIRNIESNNKVPIGVAKNKGYFRHPLIDELLIVEKINKRYKCSKERLEHFDFNRFKKLFRINQWGRLSLEDF